MALPKGSTKVAREFARCIIRRKWEDALPLFSAVLQSRKSADDLASEFGWKQLGPRLRQMHIEMTGEDEEMVPDLDPPKRCEIYEDEQRDPPADLETFAGWIEVDFQPSEDSDFDVCYNCFLAIVEENGPRIAAYEIECATE